MSITSQASWTPGQCPINNQDQTGKRAGGRQGRGHGSLGKRDIWLSYLNTPPGFRERAVSFDPDLLQWKNKSAALGPTRVPTWGSYTPARNPSLSHGGRSDRQKVNMAATHTVQERQQLMLGYLTIDFSLMSLVSTSFDQPPNKPPTPAKKVVLRNHKTQRL